VQYGLERVYKFGISVDNILNIVFLVASYNHKNLLDLMSEKYEKYYKIFG